ncbi:uncharacterized protein MICPUCDRAFT_58345 [Micromonas pusilla CCMP1545]|uniref:Predicted protein n=1 Tax=Micromonas pusilla (strain CCMP1545) TaxID=564608 RepID=C1MS47_MICPC|nr:uncharacterized protein MICPUCDRAFT_58345 [Micromonas pusilla CCMP1545]EEH57439.1 predicted protein [Micromonas pusilla CCMP1545]|eukprot:XP_003058984.1 predicted protein [Micromonas pusilla CCMP1545]
MCSRTTCGKCGKPTWVRVPRRMHIEQALRGVPEEDRCQCPRKCRMCAVS